MEIQRAESSQNEFEKEKIKLEWTYIIRFQNLL